MELIRLLFVHFLYLSIQSRLFLHPHLRSIPFRLGHLASTNRLCSTSVDMDIQDFHLYFIISNTDISKSIMD
nr:MAG TPA: hypothetical protein [Caudoviricetes sp.]